MNQVSFFFQFTCQATNVLKCYLVFFLEKSLPDLVMLFVCMPFNFQMICSVSSFTYGRLIIFSLRASVESNLHYTKHGMPCTTWPHIDLLIEIQFIEIHSGLKYVARMTVLYYGAVKDLFFISKRNMATRILWKMLTRIFCEKCLELSLTRIFW